jgi:glycosyltransferase involved in cell wall biosynthesis
MNNKQLISCVMPTYNRRRFVPQAIKYFLRQDYPSKELVILDDGTDSVADLIPSDDRIRYFRLPEKQTLGTKLNMGCELAKGEIIAHWDDDDWYSSGRLRYQVESLLCDGTDVCGVDVLIYYDPCKRRGYRYIYPPDQRKWLLGSSLCYRKELWLRNRFKEINVGMDALFIWGMPPQNVSVLREDPKLFVFMIHEGNVSPKKTNGAWWHPYDVEEIWKLLNGDREFYDDFSKPAPPVIHIESSSGSILKENSIPRPVKNIFACLVHESPECIVDLVRNLRFHDPSSVIVLYNGGKNPELLQDHFPYERYGAVRHPGFRPMTYGYLHQYALDCMEFALENFEFHTLTIVDSDQIGIRSGYSDFLAASLSRYSDIGLLGNSPQPQPANTKITPAVSALKEVELWRPFLKRFSEGESKFVHWTFWPSTVFLRDACRHLVGLFKTDSQLQSILGQTKIWATEEVILPTLVSLLGYRIAENPCSYEYVKYRNSFSLQQLVSALNRPDAFWIHPVERRYDHVVRKQIREKFEHYTRPIVSESRNSLPVTGTGNHLLLTLPILSMMKQIDGWLEEDEADLLISITQKILSELPKPHMIVEIGSYCGRSTAVIGKVAQAVSPDAQIYAIDPHQGVVGALDQGIKQGIPTIEKFNQTIIRAGLTGTVNVIQKLSYEVKWDKPVNLLLIDGLHDYFNVARDFFHFEPWISDGGLVAFHDYANYYPGVKAFVDEILMSGQFRRIQCIRSMMVVQKIAPTEQ